MKYYPICLDIKDRNCLVVGGGRVGTRKVKALLRCGARVTVVSPVISDELALLAERKRITVKRRSYLSTDLDQAFVVIGATDSAEMNCRIHADAEKRQKLCNIVDRPELCNFIVPAVVSQGDLTITVSTSGSSPAFSKYLRQQLQGQFGSEYKIFLDLMGAIRKRLLSSGHDPEAHKPLFSQLIQADLLGLVRRDERQAIDRLLAEVLGAGYSYKALLESE